MAVPRLQEKYEKEILPALKEQLGQQNRMALPRLEKVVVNMGVGSAITEKKHIEESVDAVELLTDKVQSGNDSCVLVPLEDRLRCRNAP